MFENSRTIKQRRGVKRMDKNCCSINVTELENVYRFEITGDDVKEKCKTVFENCCTKENIKNCISECCCTK